MIITCAAGSSSAAHVPTAVLVPKGQVESVWMRFQWLVSNGPPILIDRCRVRCNGVSVWRCVLWDHFRKRRTYCRTCFTVHFQVIRKAGIVWLPRRQVHRIANGLDHCSSPVGPRSYFPETGSHIARITQNCQANATDSVSRLPPDLLFRAARGSPEGANSEAQWGRTGSQGGPCAGAVPRIRIARFGRHRLQETLVAASHKQYRADTWRPGPRTAEPTSPALIGCCVDSKRAANG